MRAPPARTGCPRSPCRRPSARRDGSRCRRAPAPARGRSRGRRPRSRAARTSRRGPVRGRELRSGTEGAALPALARIRRAGLQGDAQQAGPEPPRALGVVRRELDQREGRFGHTGHRTWRRAIVGSWLAAVPHWSAYWCLAPSPRCRARPARRRGRCGCCASRACAPTLCTPSLKHHRLLARRQEAAGGHPGARRRRRRSTASTSIRRSATRRRPNANLNIDPVERSIALYQAARYSQVLPRVRADVPAGHARRRSAPRRCRSAAIRAAPTTTCSRPGRTTSRTYNHGRGVVLIGHSQGTFVLRAAGHARRSTPSRAPEPADLGDAARRQRDRAARARTSAATSSTCRPAARARSSAAWSPSRPSTSRRPPTAMFGRTTTRRAVRCSAPTRRRWAAVGGLIDPIYPSEPFAPGSLARSASSCSGSRCPTASTPWIEAPGSYAARCSSAGGANVLQISALRGAPTPKPSPDATWGAAPGGREHRARQPGRARPRAGCGIRARAPLTRVGTGERPRASSWSEPPAILLAGVRPPRSAGR